MLHVMFGLNLTFWSQLEVRATIGSESLWTQ
jgi:hypothetical protein